MSSCYTHSLKSRLKVSGDKNLQQIRVKFVSMAILDHLRQTHIHNPIKHLKWSPLRKKHISDCQW